MWPTGLCMHHCNIATCGLLDCACTIAILQHVAYWTVHAPLQCCSMWPTGLCMHHCNIATCGLLDCACTIAVLQHVAGYTAHTIAVLQHLAYFSCMHYCNIWLTRLCVHHCSIATSDLLDCACTIAVLQHLAYWTVYAPLQYCNICLPILHTPLQCCSTWSSNITVWNTVFLLYAGFEWDEWEFSVRCHSCLG